MTLTMRRQPVRKFLALHDMTVLEAAERIGCDPSHLRSVISGRAHPSDAVRDGLARIFGLPIEALIEPALLEKDYQGNLNRGPRKKPERTV